MPDLVPYRRPPRYCPTTWLLMQQFFYCNTTPTFPSLSDTRRPRQSIILSTTVHQVEYAVYLRLTVPAIFSHSPDLPDLQGPPGGGASDALDSLGKPAGWPTAPTTWRPALGTLPIDPAHFSLALLLFRQFSRRLTAVLWPVRRYPAGSLWSNGRLEKMEKGSCKIWGISPGSLARSLTASGMTRTGRQSIGPDTA